MVGRTWGVMCLSGEVESRGKVVSEFSQIVKRIQAAADLRSVVAKLHDLIAHGFLPDCTSKGCWENPVTGERVWVKK
jgi:hypothetical protein